MASDKIPDLPAELRLTQFGEELSTGPSFRDRLRESIGETELSMILGAVDAPAAAILVTGWLTPTARVRVTTVGRLRVERFVVVHSPTKRNRLHVSVYPPFKESGEPEDWDDDVAFRFNECFTGDKKGSEVS